MVATARSYNYHQLSGKGTNAAERFEDRLMSAFNFNTKAFANNALQTPAQKTGLTPEQQSQQNEYLVVQNAFQQAYKAEFDKAIQGSLQTMVAVLKQDMYKDEHSTEIAKSLTKAEDQFKEALKNPQAIAKNIITELSKNKENYKAIISSHAEKNGLPNSTDVEKENAKKHFEQAVLAKCVEEANALQQLQRDFLLKAFAEKDVESMQQSQTNTALIRRITGDNGKIVQGKAELKPGLYKLGPLGQSDLTVNGDGSLSVNNIERPESQARLLDGIRATSKPGDKYTIDLKLEPSTMLPGFGPLKSQQDAIYGNLKRNASGLGNYQGNRSAADLQQEYERTGKLDPEVMQAFLQSVQSGNTPVDIEITGHGLDQSIIDKIDADCERLSKIRNLAQRAYYDSFKPVKDYNVEQTPEQEQGAHMSMSNN